MLAQADEKDKEKWLAKDGTDWSAAFGKDPAEMIGKSGDGAGEEDEEDDDDDSTESGEADLGINDASTDSATVASTARSDDPSAYTTRGSVDSSGPLSPRSTTSNGSTESTKNPIQMYKNYKERSRDLHRQQRGLMQW